MSVKTQICSYSGQRIYPGYGTTYARMDGRVFVHIDHKTVCKELNKVHRRKVAWTQFYRRAHKKISESNTSAKRKRRVVQEQGRGYGSMTLDDIRAKQQEAVEARVSASASAVSQVKKTKKKKKAGKQSFYGGQRTRSADFKNHKQSFRVTLAGH